VTLDPRNLFFWCPEVLRPKPFYKEPRNQQVDGGRNQCSSHRSFSAPKKTGVCCRTNTEVREVSHVVEVSKFSWVFLSNSLRFIIEFEPICKQKTMEIHDLLAKVLGLYISSETVWGSESIFYPIAVWTSADEVEVSSTWGFKDSHTHHESLWQSSKQKHTNVIWRCSSWLNLPKSLVRQKLLISCLRVRGMESWS